MLRIRWIVYLVVMIALFPACNSVFSQVRPNYQINLTGTYHADAEIKDGDYFQGDKDEIRKRDFSASYQYFLYMNDKLTLIPGISFEKSGFKYDIGDKIFAGGAPDRLCSLRFKLTGSYSFDEEWSLIANTSAGFDSDFEEISPEDGNFNLMLGAGYKFSEKLSVAFGGVYSLNFGKDKFLPFAGIVYKPNDHFYIDLMREPEIGWIVNRMLKFGIEGGYHDKAYRLSSKKGRALIKSGIAEEKFIQTGIFIKSGFNRTVGLRISAGMNFGHEYKFYDEDYEDLIIDADPDNSFYVKAGVLFNFMSER